MTHRFFLAAMIAVLLSGSAQAFAAGDVGRGEQKAHACSQCHGRNGIAINPQWPDLASQTAGYLVKQLEDFKNGQRRSPVMAPQAARLSDADIADLAAYFARAVPARRQSSDTTLLALGEQVYRNGHAGTTTAACVACHGPSGGGIPPRVPRVAGQSAIYSEAQLLAFKKGERHNDNKIMSEIVLDMSEKEIRAVAQYMQTLY